MQILDLTRFAPSTLVMIVMMVLCYLSFWWSIIGVFQKCQYGMDFFYNSLKVFSLLFWGYSLYLVFEDRPQNFFVYISGVGLLIALVLFWWTQNVIRNHTFSIAFDSDIPNQLVVHGPFSMVRNPFYLSYLMAYFFVVIGLKSSVLLSLFIVLIGLYWAATKIEESKFIKSPLIEDYIKYRESTPSLVPRLSTIRRAFLSPKDDFENPRS